MLFSFTICGGALLIMMGQNTPSESLSYYFRIEDHVPEDHPLRLIAQHIDFAFIRETLKAGYSHTGRPSIDPEALLRILLVGYLYGITSERRLVEDVGMHLADRWFTGLGLIKKSRTTRHSSRIGTAVFISRRSSLNSSSALSSRV